MPVSFLPPPNQGLPPFSSFLLTGDYPPSSAIHLCVSHLADEIENKLSSSRPFSLATLPRAIIIRCGKTSKQDGADLIDYNEEWLNMHAGDGEVATLLSHVDML